MKTLTDCERVVEGAGLAPSAQRLRAGGWRFVTASCVRRPGGAFSVLYHFERDEHTRHLRLEVAPGEQAPSISAVYPAAFLVENEMIELQGLAVSGLTIDYRGRLYRDFGGAEGFLEAPADERGATMELAGALRLDASVPITPNGREVRATSSRVPPAEGEG